MSAADQSIIDLTNETQEEEVLTDTQDDIEVLSENLKVTNNNADDEPIICKLNFNKKRTPRTYEIDDSPPPCRRIRRTQVALTNEIPDSTSPVTHIVRGQRTRLSIPNRVPNRSVSINNDEDSNSSTTFDLNDGFHLEKSQDNIITPPPRQLTPLIAVPVAPPVTPGIECPICLERKRHDLASTTCGHVFCKECIKESLKASKQCPKCRKKLSNRSFHTNSLECYVCKDQEDNKDKCVETVKTCDLTEDRCTATVRWGSTPYWAPSGTKQFYISKSCSSKQQCDNMKANLTRKCDRISYNDWQCVECCHGDRCNYFVTLASSSLIPNNLILISLFISYTFVQKFFNK